MDCCLTCEYFNPQVYSDKAVRSVTIVELIFPGVDHPLKRRIVPIVLIKETEPFDRHQDWNRLSVMFVLIRSDFCYWLHAVRLLHSKVGMSRLYEALLGPCQGQDGQDA